MPGPGYRDVFTNGCTVKPASTAFFATSPGTRKLIDCLSKKQEEKSVKCELLGWTGHHTAHVTGLVVILLMLLDWSSYCSCYWTGHHIGLVIILLMLLDWSSCFTLNS